MVFSSIQAYFDSSNWQQPPPSSYHQVTGAAANGGGGGAPHILSPLPPPQSQPNGPGIGSNIRPGSMADRARMANIQMPEAALKCPRCESTNTKFCYFNNYSLTQPRHFCKNCRRYWTRGGSLRNVPVGGGCRRNRRSRTNPNPNASSTNNPNAVTAAVSGGSTSSYGHQHESILSQILSRPSLNDLTAANAAAADGMGLLSYGGGVSGVRPQDLSSIHMGSALSVSGGSLLSCIEQWKPSQPIQLPALGGGNLVESSNSSSGFYTFESANKRDESWPFGPSKISSSISSALATQLDSVKVEDNPYRWGSNGSTFPPWTDLSSFGSSG